MVIAEITNKIKKIDYNLNPNSVEGILQQARMLLATTRGTVPLDRGYGLDPNAIDKPSNIIETGLKIDINKQFKKYLPRVVVLGIKTINNVESLEIVVKVGVRDE